MPNFTDNKQTTDNPVARLQSTSGGVSPPSTTLDTITTKIRSSGNFSPNTPVYITPSGSIRRSSITDLTTNSVIGLLKTSSTIGVDAEVVLQGVLEDSNWNWDLSKPVFVGVNGSLTQNPSGSFIKQVGVPVSIDRLWVEIQPTILME